MTNVQSCNEGKNWKPTTVFNPNNIPNTQIELSDGPLNLVGSPNDGLQNANARRDVYSPLPTKCKI